MDIKANSEFVDLDEFLEGILQGNDEVEDYNYLEVEVLNFNGEQITGYFKNEILY
ncbi:hypothetical protein LGK95_19675 [Clostridium algoriphilum]|uniref:hypothetical protein n=1 Tax=Clostridium algoriphilum TaxID=198347 RepID=UPI001CF55758|nr:hypothetical protein [Clostridium algoriphilum]MCB2295699.1 hypothetical protein [Clostridium algoriphilum]